MAQQVPQLPSRSGNTDWTLYNWFSRLATSLKNFYDEVYVFMVTTVPGLYLKKTGDTATGSYTFSDSLGGTLDIETPVTHWGSTTMVEQFTLTSADFTSTQFTFYSENATGNLYVVNSTDLIFGYDLATNSFQVNNINLIGSGQRITGDFSNATASQRSSISTSTVDTFTVMQIIPNGAGTASYYQCYNTSDPDNADYVYLGHTATEARLVSGKTGSGTARPMVFYPNGVKTLTLSTAGLATWEKSVVFATQYTHPTTTGTTTIDFNNAQNIKLTQTGNVTLSFTFPGIGHFYLTIVHGANNVTWPTIGAGFQWLGSASDPALNAGTYGGLVELFYNGTMTVAKYTKIGA